MHEAAVAELNAKFTAALDNAATEAKRGGKLDEVLALQADEKSIAEQKGLPIEDAENVPESLKSLRAIYRTQMARLSETQAKNASDLIEPYSAKLQQLEVTLTKFDRVEEAVAVRQYREDLLAAVPVLTITPDGDEKPTTMVPGDSPSPPASAPMTKGDDRKAAEWILSYAVGGATTSVRVVAEGKDLTCFKIADLPAGKFSILRLVLDGFYAPLPRPITNEDMENLAGLESLTTFQVNKIGITDDGLRFLESCPKIDKILLHGLDLTDACFEHFKGLKKLTHIDFTSGCPRMVGTGIDALKESPISELRFVGTGLQDEAIPHLSIFKGLKSLSLSETKVTDTGIKSLQELSKLSALDLSQTAVTPEAILSLKGLNLTNLSLGQPDTWDEIVSQLPTLAAAFPGIVETTLPRFATYSRANLEPVAIAYPKLKSLSFTDPKFEPGATGALARFEKVERLHLSSLTIKEADLAALTEMKSLQELTLGITFVSDEGLKFLGGIKKLKKLTFKQANVTPAALAAFKKEHPDVVLK